MPQSFVAQQSVEHEQYKYQYFPDSYLDNVFAPSEKTVNPDCLFHLLIKTLTCRDDLRFRLAAKRQVLLRVEGTIATRDVQPQRQQEYPKRDGDPEHGPKDRGHAGRFVHV